MSGVRRRFEVQLVTPSIFQGPIQNNRTLIQ